MCGGEAAALGYHHNGFGNMTNGYIPSITHESIGLYLSKTITYSISYGTIMPTNIRAWKK